MPYEPKLGEPVEIESISVEIEEEDGMLKGEHVRYDQKGVLRYRTTYYVVIVNVLFMN